MKRPFVFMTIPLIMGIIFSYYFNLNISIVFSLVMLLIGVYIFNIIKRKSNPINIFLIFIGLGMILTRINLNSSILSTKVEKSFRFKGVVEDIKWKEPEQSKYIVKVINLRDDIESIDLKEKIVLKIIGDKEIEIGDEITFDGKLKKPLENTNPKLFNYKLSLLSDKIYTTTTIKDYSIVEINTQDKSLKYRIKISFRKSIEELFDNNLNVDNSSLMKSIVLGEYSYLEEENIARYRNLGLAHILAVSGLHIGIIAGFLIFILSNLSIKRKKAVIITLGTIWFYGFLIGFPPSLLRANIMFSILFYVQILAEPYDSINSLFFAMFVLLIINPMWIFNLGFQLSFSATFSIMYFTPRVHREFYPYKNKITYALAGLIGVRIGLLPIQAYYFNKISILSILANLIIAPILSLALVVGASMIGISYLVSPLNMILGFFLNHILTIQFKLVEILDSLPFGTIRLYTPNIFEIIIYYILILMIFKIIDIKKLKPNITKMITYYLIVVILSSSIILATDKSIEIHFIDVGQGDCILLRSGRGDYLIDTGGNMMSSFDIGENITLPYLQKLGIKKLKGVFITHFDDDHSKSLPTLIDNINIENVLVSYEDNSNESFNKVKEKEIPLLILKEKDNIVLDRNTSIEVLSPNQSLIDSGTTANDLSLVFLLSYYNKEILFTGDMEKKAENLLLDKIDKQIDIIKVPHHGSNTSSAGELLNKLRPEIGVISVGRNNLYGHPRKEVLDRYEDIDTKLYRTDTMGMVKIILNKGDIQIYPFITDKLRLDSFLNDNLLIFILYIGYYLISYILIKIYTFTEEEMDCSELQ